MPNLDAIGIVSADLPAGELPQTRSHSGHEVFLLSEATGEIRTKELSREPL